MNDNKEYDSAEISIREELSKTTNQDYIALLHIERLIALAGQDKSEEVIEQYLRVENLELSKRVHKAIAEHAERTQSPAWNIEYKEISRSNTYTERPSVETPEEPEASTEVEGEYAEYLCAVQALMHQH